MWYVIQVRTGHEDQTLLQCQNKIDTDVMERCFLPYYEEKRHIRGKWVTQKKLLFPGYIFIVSDALEQLHEQLKSVIGMTRLLEIGGTIVPLSEEEVTFLKKLGGEEQVVEMSEGIIVNSKVKIRSGPLEGLEGFIQKIDRHKRKAYLRVPMFGREQMVQVGLEIVEKVNI